MKWVSGIANYLLDRTNTEKPGTGLKVNGYTLCARQCQYDAEHIDDFISGETTFTVSDNQRTIREKLSLQVLKHKLMTETQISLTEYDEYIVGRIWTIIILNRWLDEAVSAFKHRMENCQDIDIIQDQLQELQTRDFWSIKILQNHPLQEIVNENKGMFDEENVKICLESYSNQCLSQLLEKNNTISNELRFLEEFMKVLKESADKTFVSTYRAIITEDRMSCKNRFRWLLVKVIEENGENQLAEIATTLRNEVNIFLATQFFDIVSKFFVPMKVKIYKLDGIIIAEVTGSAYSLSDVWNCDPTTFDNTEGLDIDDADEFHLISHLSIDLDRNFLRPGVNLVIKTVRLTSSPNIIIDVSGDDIHHKRYNSDAGTNCNGQGKDGRDGYAGNSAGNVLIEVDYCDSYPRVLANGSDGTNGQDGGNGKDGQDGTGMTTSELKESFGPAAAYVLGIRSDRVEKIINSMDKNLDTVIKAWWTGEDATTWNGVWENIKEKKNGRTYFFDIQQRIDYYHNTSIFLRVKLKSGVVVTFAFECGGHLSWTNCQSYMLVEGTDGTMGGDGGKAGRGGRGGFAGSVSINQQVRSGTAGMDGSNGKAGKNGTNGKNGWDIGWLDYSVSNAFGADKWPKYYGTNHDTKLELKPFVNSNSERVVCPCRKKENYADFMMEMRSRKIENPKQRETSAQCTKQGNIEHHAVPTRKSNVRADVVREHYSDLFISVERMMTSLRQTHNSTCEATQRTVDLEQHHNQVRADMTVNRQMEFTEVSHTRTHSSVSSVLDIKSTQPIWQSVKQKFMLKLFDLLSKIEISKEVMSKLCPVDECTLKCDNSYLQQTQETSSNFRRFIIFFEDKEPYEFKKAYKELRKKEPTKSLRVLREFIIEKGSHGVR